MSEFEDIDYEEIDEIAPQESKGRPDDFMSIIVDQVYGFDWFMMLAVAIAFLIVVSNTFRERALDRIPGATKNGELTTYGYMMQLIALLIGSILGKIFFTFI